MSDDVVITCDKIGKRYRLGAAVERAETFGGALVNGLRRPFRHLLAKMREATEAETLWALKDVSFEAPNSPAVSIHSIRRISWAMRISRALRLAAWKCDMTRLRSLTLLPTYSGNAPSP